MMTLSLSKPGEEPAKLRLFDSKNVRFVVELSWDCESDLDVFALLLKNPGTGGKVPSLKHVLSSLNSPRVNPHSELVMGEGASFGTPCGTLIHLGDARSGAVTDVDEVLKVDGSRVTKGINEISIFVSVHRSQDNPKLTFGDVRRAVITIRNEEGVELGSYRLSKEFEQFNTVQMGCLLLEEDGWEFFAVGKGYNGDINTVLDYFS